MDKSHVWTNVTTCKSSTGSQKIALIYLNWHIFCLCKMTINGEHDDKIVGDCAFVSTIKAACLSHQHRKSDHQALAIPNQDKRYIDLK